MGLYMEGLIDRAARALVGSKYAVALTGAGISTESGIPDFRGPEGVWTRDKEAEERAYQTYDLFLEDPRAYWEEMTDPHRARGGFYHEISQAKPNRGHYALAELEKRGILKGVITQNIDGLHEKAGSKRVLEYHGSVSRLRCLSCGARYRVEKVSLEKLPPRCRCGEVLKSDVVYFKEPIPSDVAEKSEEEALKCDLMLICGTSAVVYPFANLPLLARFRFESLPAELPVAGYRTEVKIIEVNAEPTPLTREGVSDYLIQGKTGEILPRIVEQVNKVSPG